MFMESWIFRVSCKVNVTYFARDPKYSWFHDHSKNRIHFLIIAEQSTVLQEHGPPFEPVQFTVKK